MTRYRAYRALTKAQQRTLVAGYIDTPVRLTTTDGAQHDVILQGTAQDAHTDGADPYSQKGNLVVARFYATRQLVVFYCSDIATIDLLPLSPTDPRSPEYAEEPQVVRPIPREALAARKVGGENRHAQR